MCMWYFSCLLNWSNRSFSGVYCISVVYVVLLWCMLHFFQADVVFQLYVWFFSGIGGLSVVYVVFQWCMWYFSGIGGTSVV